MCTTLAKHGNLSGNEVCGLVDNVTGEFIDGTVWHSCEEWCLSKNGKSCSHVYASARDLGTQIYWDECDNSTIDAFVDHKCNIIQDEERMNCKLYPTETNKNAAGEVYPLESGSKDRCSRFNDIQVLCESGVCRNYSAVYKCDFQDVLDEIQEDWNDQGYCYCQKCSKLGIPQHLGFDPDGGCPDFNRQCIQWYPNFPNSTMQRHCNESVPCSSCWDICNARQQCFDMTTRRDPTMIGTDSYGLPKESYYNCNKGKCSEIHSLTCERRCNEKVFDTKGKNTFIFNGERIIVASCAGRSVASGPAMVDHPRLYGKKRDEDVLMVSCSVIKLNEDGHQLQTEDCVNGTWFPNDFNGGSTNYSFLTRELARRRELAEYREETISYEPDITIFNKTKLKINIEGCKNNLNKSCTAFYENYGGDGRNHTARAVYECFFDPNNGDYVVVEFDPQMTLLQLLLFSLIPGAIMIVSCIYMCGCSRFIEVQEDGHMRLMCCGKAVTGIGNVPKWDPPRRKHKLLTEKDKELELAIDVDDNEDDENDEKASGKNGDASAPPKYFDH